MANPFRLSKPTYCADQKLHSEYDPAIHCKYNAKYYFIEDKETRLPAPRTSARRTAEAQFAYSEFMQGLEAIGQQEYLYPWSVGAKLLPNSFRAPNDILNKSPVVRLEDLAAWERQIRDRSDAWRRMQFSENLLRRSRMSLESLGDASVGIPIRHATYELLTTPPERDWSLVAVIVALFTVINYWYQAATAIYALTELCAGPFFCPVRPLGSRVMVVPPARFRSTGQVVKLTYDARAPIWEPETQSSEGGYLTQWPYLQRHTGATGPDGVTPEWYSKETVQRLDQLAQDLKLLEPTWAPNNKCTVRNASTSLCTKTSSDSGIEDCYYVFDPFKRIIQEEFFDCGASEQTFQITHYSGDPSAANRSDYRAYETTITFMNAHYKTRRTETVDCMYTRKKDATVGLSAWWTGLKNDSSAFEPELRAVEQCVESKLLKSNELHECECHERKWQHYPLKFFYASENMRTCQSGPSQGEPCTQTGDTNTCRPGKSGPAPRCELRWPNSMPISRHARYGCFFEEPDAKGAVNTETKSCALSPSNQHSYESAPGKIMPTEAQEWFTSSVFTKRAAMLLIFLGMQLGYLSGCVVVSVILLVLVLLMIALFPISLGIWFVLQTKDDKHLQTRISVVNLCNGIYIAIYSNLELIFHMVTRFSALHQSLVVLFNVLRGTVNTSLTDFDVKFTSISSAMYNFALMLVMESTSERESGGTSAIVWSTIILLLQLFFKLMKERQALLKLQSSIRDLNENRLSKFEVALLWIKHMEFYLEDDIQFNFVEVFHSSDPLMPDFDEPRYAAKGLQSDYESAIAPQSLDSWRYKYVSTDERKRVEFYRQALDPKLAGKFGHDGSGLDYSPDYGKAKGTQTVCLNASGLLQLVPGISEAAIINGNGRGDQIQPTHESDPTFIRVEEGPYGQRVERESRLFYGPENPASFGKRPDRVIRPTQTDILQEASDYAGARLPATTRPGAALRSKSQPYEPYARGQSIRNQNGMSGEYLSHELVFMDQMHGYK